MLWHWLLVLLLLFQGNNGADQCGTVSPEDKVIGGEAVKPQKYPWYVALVEKLDLMNFDAEIVVNCGGSLVTSRHVLTAAHCFKSKDGKTSFGSISAKYKAIFGLKNRCDAAYDSAVDIDTVILNPDYNVRTSTNDLALAVLSKSVTNQPVCLPGIEHPFPKQGDVIGFGITKIGKEPCSLREAPVNIFSASKCSNSYNDIVEGQLCAAGPNYSTDTCLGDSGGPLLVTQDNTVYIIGITSYGYGCAVVNEPGVYTNVSYYVKWILKEIHSHEETDQSSGGIFNWLKKCPLLSWFLPGHIKDEINKLL